MGKKILLADDSITIQKVIELTFSDEDFEVVTVGNGRLAIEKVQEVRPDVVLCDVIMPEKDGYEVCDFIKRSPQLSSIPVLLLTGAFEPFDQERAARVGCDGFLAKPFEPETLIAKVKDLLSKTAARQAPAPAPPPRQPTGPVVVAPPPAPPPPPPAFVPQTFAPPPVATPFAAAPPQVGFAPPPAPRPPIAEPEMAFIPDEPFEDIEPPMAAPSPLPPPEAAYAAPVEESVEDLVPITPEESEALSVGGDDASSTVMFKADAMPWVTSPSPAAAPAPIHNEPAAVVEPEPIEAMTEMPIFEEVIEESEVQASSATVIMTGESPFAAVPSPPPAAAPFAAPSPAVPFAPVPAAPSPVVAPPAAPPPPVAAAAFVAPPPAPAPPPVVVAPPPPPPPAPVAAPPVVAAPPAAFEDPVSTLAPEPVAWKPAPAVWKPEPLPEPAAPAPPPEAPAPPAPVSAEAPSFADVAAAIEEPTPEPARPSVAAQVEVPVDMVSQIAHRVLSQLSEKVVERIVWEVVPDLAEGMIKREIERLKAELQQLG